MAEKRTMITLTRLNDKAFVLNAELIKTVEETPDTVITLMSGDRMMVRETPREVVDKAIEYARQVRGLRVV
jgi:flagellar protein FlbD